MAYPPAVIIHTLLEAFFPYRGLAPVPRGLGSGAARAPTSDDVVNDMEQFFYVRLDARRARPRGARDWVVVLVLKEDGKYAHHGPDLRKLLDGVEAERPAREGRLDELLVVASEDFFRKKNLMDVVHELRGRQAGGADPGGVAPFYGAYPYHNFCCVIPASQSVPPHQLLTDAEVDEFLRAERLALRDLPVLFTSDPPVVWLGGREGQVVRILRPSHTAGVAPYLRRLERG
jgi:DNA-directed RNA polymerase subunit H